jgi:hypothetical protein
VILAGGLALIVALAAPAAAQAQVRASAAVPAYTGTSQGCYEVQQADTRNWASDYPPGDPSDHDWLYFEGLDNATPYCLDELSDGWYEITDYNTGNCLALDSSANDAISEDTAVSVGPMVPNQGRRRQRR